MSQVTLPNYFIDILSADTLPTPKTPQYVFIICTDNLFIFEVFFKYQFYL